MPMADIVFFGEPLPDRFAKLSIQVCPSAIMCRKLCETVPVQDLPQCDMLIVMGTSLTVQPFASLAERYTSFFYFLCGFVYDDLTTACPKQLLVC